MANSIGEPHASNNDDFAPEKGFLKWSFSAKSCTVSELSLSHPQPSGLLLTEELVLD